MRRQHTTRKRKQRGGMDKGNKGNKGNRGNRGNSKRPLRRVAFSTHTIRDYVPSDRPSNVRNGSLNVTESVKNSKNTSGNGDQDKGPGKKKVKRTLRFANSNGLRRLANNGSSSSSNGTGSGPTNIFAPFSSGPQMAFATAPPPNSNGNSRSNSGNSRNPLDF